MVGKKCVIKGHLLLRLGVGWGFISRALVIATAVYPKFMESFVCLFSTGCSVCYHLMIMFFICLPNTFDVTLQFLGWYHGWSGLEDNAHIGCCVIQMKHINEAQTRVVNVYMSCDWLSWCATVIPCSQQNPRCKKHQNFAPLYEDVFCWISTLAAISLYFIYDSAQKMTLLKLPLWHWKPFTESEMHYPYLISQV